MRLIPCALFERWMDAAVDGELRGWRARALDRHLRACPRCAEAARVLARLTARLHALGAPPAPDVRVAVRTALARQPLPAPARPRSRGVPLIAASGVAVVLVVAVAWWVSGPRSDAPDVAAVAEPATPADWFAEGEALEAEGWLAEAAAYYRAAFEQTGDAVAGLALARVESARGEYMHALSTYTAVAVGPAPWQSDTEKGAVRWNIE